MATIFSDGFESNFSAWTGTTGSGTHLETVENLNPHHGTYNAKFYTASTDDFSCVYKDITSSPIVYCGLYCKFSALPVNDGETLHVGLTQNVASGLGVGTFLSKYEGSLYWGLKIDGTGFYEAVPSNPVVDTWYCVEFLRDVTNNIETLWVDGVVKVNQTRVIANNSDRVFFGNTWINYATPTSIYVDCCVVSDSYIGPEATGGDSALYYYYKNSSSTQTRKQKRNELLQNIKSLLEALTLT